MSKAVIALEDAKRLLTYTRSGERWIISDLADALEAALEGLYHVYVNLGEDTDGARNAKELFGPWVGFDPATHVPTLVAEARKQWEEDYDSDLIKEYERGLEDGREQVRDED